MTPPTKKIWQAESQPDGVCAGHASFERLIFSGMESLSEQIKVLAEAIRAQNKENSDALAKVLNNQSDRRELCGQQTARIVGLESKVAAERAETLDARKEVWAAINKLKFYVYTGVGIIIAINAIAVLMVKMGH